MIGMHSFFYIICAFALSKYLRTIGRKRIMLMGCILQASGCILQSIVSSLPRDGYNSLLIIVYTSRTLQGVGGGCY